MHYFRGSPYHRGCEPLVQIPTISILPSVASLATEAISVSHLNTERSLMVFVASELAQSLSINKEE
jgi:hypothetical protein